VRVPIPTLVSDNAVVKAFVALQIRVAGIVSGEQNVTHRSSFQFACDELVQVW